MALYLKVSNSLDSLAKELSESLEQENERVFDPHYIVTQTEGMNNWLKLQLAQRIGIAANYRFLKPNDLIYQFYTVLGGPFSQMLSVQNLNWLIFKLLGEKEFTDKFPAVALFYQNSGPERDIRRMSLAEKLGDLFDQYQVYRPQLIKEWNNDGTEGNTDEEWQQWLWKKAKILSGDSLPDKTLIGNYILTALKDPAQVAKLVSCLPYIHLFGLSITTSYHVQILHEISNFIDIHFFIINPAPSVYWFDDKNEKQLAVWRQKGFKIPEGSTPGNSLLTGWGRVIQESFLQFFQYDDFLNAYEDIGIITPEPDSLLHKIQHDIFNAAVKERNPLILSDITDGSITINACYTVAREVEVLYNYLVHLVDKKGEDLSTRDIVLMVTDIDTYAPFIKAVFGNAPYPFRYTIADESFAGNDNLFFALQAILMLTEENFKAEEVMQLLDFTCIRKRFALTDIIHIRSIVDAATIRFGLDGNTDEQTNLVSWRYGIKRIMFGICMSGEPEYGEGANSFYPLDLVEGNASLELIRFCHFAEVLMSSIENRKVSRSVAEWIVYVEQLLRNLVFEPAEDTDEDYNVLLRELSGYNAINEYMNDKVSFDVFIHSFLQTLAGTKRTGLFVNGGITFCSLIPMRSIPFKVVALLGLNYDKFPRKDPKIGFNLMEKKRLLGDRNVRENDKHLFLETILSARKYLYFSYIGKKANDNTMLPPSALIDELIDYIEEGGEETMDVRKSLVTLQPLHSFSRLYNQGSDRFYSYLNNPTHKQLPLINENKVNDPFLFDQIQLNELIQFFKNPFKFYYNKVLGIYYNEEQVLLSETEIFNLDHLMLWSLNNRMLPLEEGAVSLFQNELLKKGELPLGGMASVVIQEVDEKVNPLRSLYIASTGGVPEETISIELILGDSQLIGILQGVFDGKLVRVSWSKNETKYLVEAYIHYLAGCAAETITGLDFISFVGKEKTFHAEPLSNKEALARLSSLIKIYKMGFDSIAPFYPDFKLVPGKVEELDFTNFTKLVNETVNSSFIDPFIKREYDNGYFDNEAILDTYQDICRQVILPLGELFPGYYAKK